MTTSLDALLGALHRDARKASSERNGDDIVRWIKANWALFVPSRKDMDRADSMIARGIISCDADGYMTALSMDDRIRFMRYPCTDVLRAMRIFQKSKLLEKFRKMREEAGTEIILIVVAGQATSIVTDCRIIRPAGVPVLQYTDGGGREISVFGAEFAKEVMGPVFTPTTE